MARVSSTERFPAAQVVRGLRVRHGLTQAQVARLLRTNTPRVARWDRGTVDMPEGYFELFCIKLGEDFETLIEAETLEEKP